LIARKITNYLKLEKKLGAGAMCTECGKPMIDSVMTNWIW
jgi:hypothetical protein